MFNSRGSAGDGGLATATQLFYPSAVAVATAAQQLFIADSWNHAVRMVDLVTGFLTTLAGKLGSYGKSGDWGHAQQGMLHYPTGIATTMLATSIYVADTSNHAVRL